MFERSPIGRLFVPGKIIQIRRGRAIERIVFVEVQEHIRHVRAMLDFLYPNAGKRLQLGADWHDLGKKFLNYDYSRALRNVLGKKRKDLAWREKQVADFWEKQVDDTVTPTEAFEAFKRFVRTGKDGTGTLTRHVVIWPHRSNPVQRDEITGYDYRFDPPFGFHAAEVEETDLPDGLSDADRRYLLDLIHLHHSFQADKLVAAAAENGETLIHDLHDLMVCDHFGSGWAEYVVQALEQGDLIERGCGMRFAEFELQPQGEVRVIKREEQHVHGQVTLAHDGRRFELDVHYYVFDFHLDGEAEMTQQPKRGRDKR